MIDLNSISHLSVPQIQRPGISINHYSTKISHFSTTVNFSKNFQPQHLLRIRRTYITKLVHNIHMPFSAVCTWLPFHSFQFARGPGSSSTFSRKHNRHRKELQHRYRLYLNLNYHPGPRKTIILVQEKLGHRSSAPTPRPQILHP